MAAVLALLALVAATAPSLGEPPTRLEIDFEPHGTLRWDMDATPVLLVQPRRGDGWITIARRTTGRDDPARARRAAHPDLASVRLDRPVAVPVELLSGELRLAVVRRFFPLDRRTGEGWEHEVLDPFTDGVEETWDWLAALFTGSDANA
ncbi:MAG TPA: hypothetical protein VLT32_00350, partial [Candidatus Sulfomarinibacteraceae bacterium]|nr:hypothetical protein [Candidatus Sulfomarinibacteraceae bacterium]